MHKLGMSVDSIVILETHVRLVVHRIPNEIRYIKYQDLKKKRTKDDCLGVIKVWQPCITLNYDKYKSNTSRKMK